MFTFISGAFPSKLILGISILLSRPLIFPFISKSLPGISPDVPIFNSGEFIFISTFGLLISTPGIWPLISRPKFPISTFGALISPSGRFPFKFKLISGLLILIFLPFKLGPSISGEDISTLGPFIFISPLISLFILGKFKLFFIIL